MKIALITGATSGIGEGCARRFARGGYDLIITGRNTGKLEILKKELEAEGVKVLALAFDVRNREAARKAVDYIPQDWRNIDVLINNAGLARGLEPEYQGSFEDWDQMIDTNIKGLLTMTRLIVPGMVRRNHGHIINIGSVAGDAAYAGGNVYCATKLPSRLSPMACVLMWLIPRCVLPMSSLAWWRRISLMSVSMEIISVLPVFIRVSNH